MLNKGHLSFIAAALAALGLASCGSGASSISPDSSGTANTALEQATNTGSGDEYTLPSIPLDEEDSRSASGVDTPPPPGEPIVVLGKDYLQQFNGTVDGDSLVLASPPQDSERFTFAWGLYRVSGLSGLRPVDLNIQCLPGGLDQEYTVGVANYTKGRWDWFGPSSLPEMDIDMSQPHGRYVSRTGNMYFIVVVTNGDSATFSQATVLTVQAGGDVPPGCPVALKASDGLPGHIEVGWLAGQGNNSFELYRAAKPAEGGKPEWTKLADLSENRYVDTSVEPLKPYLYRVRATNEAGESCFSNVDPGFAAPLGGGGGLDGTVGGRVVLGQTEEGLGGIVVALVGGPGPGPWMANTGPEGYFRFEHLPAGAYIVVPMAPNLDFNPGFLPVLLSKDHPVAATLFHAHPDFEAHVLWGFAFTMGGPDDPGLHPLAGTRISITPADGGDAVVVEAGEHGFWHSGLLPKGKYSVSAALDSFVFHPEVAQAGIDGEHRTPALNFFGLPPGVNPPPPGGDPGA